MTLNQKYQYKKQDQEQQYQYNSSGSSSTTATRSQACSSRADINMQIEALTPVYTALFGGRGIPIAIAQYFARLLAAGMEPAVIAHAINATGWARIPTPYYMRAILQRYLYEGIMNEAQLMHDQQERDYQRDLVNAEREEIMYE